jgi:hypothetical protein
MTVIESMVFCAALMVAVVMMIVACVFSDDSLND